jgi:hypothetical protein
MRASALQSVEVPLFAKVLVMVSMPNPPFSTGIGASAAWIRENHIVSMVCIRIRKRPMPTPTECSADLFGFAPVEKRAAATAFAGGAMTPGALLLGATDRSVVYRDRTHRDGLASLVEIFDLPWAYCSDRVAKIACGRGRLYVFFAGQAVSRDIVLCETSKLRAVSRVSSGRGGAPNAEVSKKSAEFQIVPRDCTAVTRKSIMSDPVSDVPNEQIVDAIFEQPELPNPTDDAPAPKDAGAVKTGNVIESSRKEQNAQRDYNKKLRNNNPFPNMTLIDDTWDKEIISSIESNQSVEDITKKNYVRKIVEEAVLAIVYAAKLYNISVVQLDEAIDNWKEANGEMTAGSGTERPAAKAAAGAARRMEAMAEAPPTVEAVEAAAETADGVTRETRPSPDLTTLRLLAVYEALQKVDLDARELGEDERERLARRVADSYRRLRERGIE